MRGREGLCEKVMSEGWRMVHVNVPDLYHNVCLIQIFFFVFL